MVKALRSLLTVLLTVLLLLSALAPAFAADDPMAQYTDLKKDWSYNSIRWCVENGIMVGTSPDTFSPNLTVTRAQFVTVLCRLAEDFGYNMAGYSLTDRFPDVRRQDWYAKEVTWGVKNGVVSGLSSGEFGGDGALTRQDMAVLIDRFLRNYLLYDDGGTEKITFTDAKKISSYAREATNDLASLGLLYGDGGACRPQRTMTRAEMAAMAQRLYLFVTENDAISPFARLKFGINLFTFLGCCSLPNAKAVLKNIHDGGMDHIRLQMNPTLVSDYDIPIERNYYKDADGVYHLRIQQDVMDRAYELCKIATDLGMSVILDQHDYYCYPNLIVGYESFIAQEREKLEKQLEKQTDPAYIDAANADLALLDRILSEFRADPDAAVVNVMDGMTTTSKCEYHISRFSPQYGIADDFLAYVTLPNGNLEPWEELWGAVAERFADFGDNVFFELINERKLEEEDVISATCAIRNAGGENNKQRMIVVYTYCWDYYRPDSPIPRGSEREDWDFGKYNSDPNIMFDMHHYQPALYTNGTRESVWISAEAANESQRAATLRRRYLNEMQVRTEASRDLRNRTGRYVWIGETGCTKLPQGRDEYYEEMIADCVAKGLPVCFWAAADSYYMATDTSLTFFYTNHNCWHEPTRHMIFN